MIYAADLFCGAGGSSTGLLQACEQLDLDVELLAINHWDTAVETHAANHPNANHLCSGLDEIDPHQAIPGRKLDILLAGPECTHHSRARGGKPADDQSRASAWHVLHWAERLRVENIVVENVQEFLTWGPLGANGRPLKSRRGETFKAWLAALESLNYHVTFQVINSADHGDATTRRRLFILATRRHKRRQLWPNPTHTQDPTDTLFPLPRWRAAREIIDWSLPSQSIFNRKRPLRESTLLRIQEGLRKFGGLEFLLGHKQFKEQLIDSTERPLRTITASNGGDVQLVQPFIIPRYGERPGQTPRTHSVDAPMPTVPASCQHNLIEPFILPYYGKTTTHSTTQPLPTITTKDRFGLVEQKHLDIHYRMLQPHELAAAMSFPADFHFAGNKADKIRQIGNAWPVRTGQALCHSILQHRRPA